MIKFFNADTKEEIVVKTFMTEITKKEDINDLIKSLTELDVSNELIDNLNTYLKTGVFNSVELDLPFYSYLANNVFNEGKSCIIFGCKNDEGFDFYSSWITTTKYEAVEEIISQIDRHNFIPVYLKQII